MYNKRRIFGEVGDPWRDAAPCGARIRARPTPRSWIDQRDWDRFAVASGGSILGSYRHMTSGAVRNWFRQRLVLLQIEIETAEGARKIGQCAVSVSSCGARRFVDGIHLAPGDETHWHDAFAAVLRAMGPGAYQYGGEWSLEPAREAAIAATVGVDIESVRPLVVQAVDFARWPDWDDYYRGVVGNVRRAATAAPRRYPDLAVAVRKGRLALGALRDLTRLRTSVAERKDLDVSPLRFLLTRLAMTLTCSPYVIAGVARAEGRALGAFYGAEFGRNTYYLDGASAAQNFGASWRLLFTMMERAFSRAPTGKFVMGYVDYALHEEARGGGLLRSRRACRVSDYSTSIVRFRYG